MWQRWYLNQCVGVGWQAQDGYLLVGEIARSVPSWKGWVRCRNLLNHMVVGDYIVVTLADSRAARIGQITGFAIEDAQWNPLVPPSKTLPYGEIGRRILVRWNLTTGPDDRGLVVVLPEGKRFALHELRPTLAEVRSMSLEQLIDTMNDPTNWVNLLGHFAYERALSEYIAAYPYKLEDGLLQHPSEKVREKVFGDGRRSDVLLIDRTGRSVVVECKQNAPTIADCDQLLHYLELLRGETGALVRGILVHGGAAKLRKDISEYAAAKSIEIVRYRLDVEFLPCA
jgi:hypothetical protein